MNIYTIALEDSEIDYDMIISMVVSAGSESEARCIASDKAMEHYQKFPEAWLDPKRATCKLVDKGEKRVICTTFYNG